MRGKLHRLARPSLLLAPALLLQGCVSIVASTAVAIVKAPFQLAGAAVDGLTTSQQEADRNAGKKARKEREHAEKEQEKAEKARRKAEKRAREAEDN